MSARSRAWVFGLPLIIPAVAWTAWAERTGELAVPLALASLGLVALVAESAGLRARSRTGHRPRTPEAARPADGVVDILPMADVEATPLPEDPRWRRFDRLADARSRPDRPGPLRAETPALLGRVALLSVFVGRDGRAWTGPELARAHQALDRAGRWIEREAIRLGAPVNIGLAETFFLDDDDADDRVEVAYVPEGDDVGPMEADASAKAVAGMSRVAARLGFADVVGLLERVNSRVEADAHAWLIHLRRAGRSIAIPAAESEISGVGLAICYAREASFPEPLTGPGRVDPITVVHELLHLFGAIDKYGLDLDHLAEGRAARDDIMRLDRDALSRMVIGPTTASEIGWPRPAQPGGKGNRP